MKATLGIEIDRQKVGYGVEVASAAASPLFNEVEVGQAARSIGEGRVRRVLEQNELGYGIEFCDDYRLKIAAGCKEEIQKQLMSVLAKIYLKWVQFELQYMPRIIQACIYFRCLANELIHSHVVSSTIFATAKIMGSAPRVVMHALPKAHDNLLEYKLYKSVCWCVEELIPTWMKSMRYLVWPQINPMIKENKARFCFLLSNILFQLAHTYWLQKQNQVLMEKFNSVAYAPTIDMGEFKEALGAIIKFVIFEIGFYVSKHAVSSLYTSSLKDCLKRKIADEWLESGAYYGKDYIALSAESTSEDVDAARIIDGDVANYLSTTDFLMKSIVGTAGTVWLALENFSSLDDASAVWDLLLLVQIVKTTTMVCSAFIEKFEKRITHLIELHRSQVQDVSTNNEAIAFSGGMEFERQRLEACTDEVRMLFKQELVLNSILDVAQFISGFGSWAMGVWLCNDKLAKKEISVDKAFFIGNSLNGLIQVLTWNDSNINSIVSAQVSHDRIKTFLSIIFDWKLAIDKRDAKLSTRKVEQQVLQFDGRVTDPSGKLLFDGKLDLKPGGRYRLAGPSNCGKSTMFRSLAEFWPHVEGSLIISKRIKVLHQHAYIRGYGMTLLEIVRYPNRKPATRVEIEKIKQLMLRFGFKEDEDKIKHLEHTEWRNADGETVKANWVKTLSGGEKQRIVFIGAMLSNPEILFMDEATNAIDAGMKSEMNRYIIEEQMKRDFTVVFIDHNPSEGFATEEIDISKHVRPRNISEIRSAAAVADTKLSEESKI